MPLRFPLRSPERASLTGRLIRALSVMVALLIVPGALHAEEAASPWFTTEQGRVRLIAAEPAVGAGDAVWLGLQFELAPHWKVYWRSPGDAGYPPHLDWAGSENLAGAAVAWPAPERFTVLGFETMGYEDAVVLPITARLAKPGALLKVRAALQYLTCEIVCIPYETTLALDLPAEPAPDGATGFGALIARYRSKVPGDGGASGIRLEGASLETGAKPVLSLALAADPPLAHPDAFVEGPDGVSFSAPILVVADPGHPSLRLRAFGNPSDIAELAKGNLVVTVVDGGRAMEAATVPVEAPPPVEFAGLLPMMLVALIGGFILNLMPCVLPVLSLKLLGAVGHAAGGSAALRRGFLASAAGILLSFLLLAGAMIGLRASGVAVGWGLQFQQPVFLVAMAALTTLFAANLWGWLEIPLPRFIADRAPGASGEGSLAGNVAAGAFATLLATPCSAPFLGTAVGFALAGTSLDILVIFATLGLGLALPYLAVALVPDVARWLPRPGRWMIVLRGILGAALLGTAAWLVFVLSAEAGPSVALVVAAAMAVVLAVLGTLGAPRLRAAGASLAIVVALVAAAVAPSVPEEPTTASDALWQPFDRGRIAELVAEGKVVFVDVTARWCLTCLANKRLVLDRSSVRDSLSAPGTVAMAADWTRPDPVIAAYLRSYGRYGIPFNAVYGPSAPQGIALSELLTPEDVLGALALARQSARAGGDASQSPANGG
jgi:suppressor for copper-sensitivity B